MKICVIGKYPPIQGGVSMRTYWTAHGLAALGHEVHVITNAKEVAPPFRMYMREQDWARCEATYGSGSVRVHWSEPMDRSQFYIPTASAFVSKLATLAANAHAACGFDVIFSHYLEPYGIVGYLAARMTGAPHVVRMAGSDAGRLWHHPQFEALYDHILRSAELVVAAHVVAARAIERGVDPGRIRPGGGYALPKEFFTPNGPPLDLAALRAEIATDEVFRDSVWGDFAGDRPYFGIYGKLGDNKGTFALLSALHLLKQRGVDVGLVAVAHGRAEIEQRFRTEVREFGLADRVLQLPFLPHWRIPEFLRGCLAVCCLEQDFPIGFHSPITPLEVMTCGACLVGAAEVIRKLPNYQRLAHGYSCVVVEDVNDVAALSKTLGAIAEDPGRAPHVGARGHLYTRDAQDLTFPRRLEALLAKAAQRAFPAKTNVGSEMQEPAFPFARMAAAALEKTSKGRSEAPSSKIAAQLAGEIDLTRTRELLSEIDKSIQNGKLYPPSLAQGLAAELAIAEAEYADAEPSGALGDDPLFRLKPAGWAVAELDFEVLVPIVFQSFRVLHFPYDLFDLRGARTVAELPETAAPRRSQIIVFNRKLRRDPLIVDDMTARFLEEIDGRKTVADILNTIDDGLSHDIGPWIESLLIMGIIGFVEKRKPAASPIDAPASV